MSSSITATAHHPLVRRAGWILYGVALAMFGAYLGFSHGWDAARQAELPEVRLSVECEPPAAI